MSRYCLPILFISAGTGILKIVFPHVELVNLAMVYLLANVLIAVRYGQGPSIASAALSVSFFDFFFVPPYLTFAVANEKYWITFGILFLVSILISRLTLRLKQSTEEACFLSSISHDLRTPLTSIAGAASTLLEQKRSEEDTKKLLSMINDESAHLNRMVENILQITKIESGNIQLRKEKQSLEEIIGSTLNRLDAALQGRSVSIRIPENLPMIPMDPLLIGQVLINLLENAIRHTPGGSPIEIRVFQNRKSVCVEVADRGPGISLKEGSGLGLTICRGILKTHGAKMDRREAKGGGSVFYFSLPLS
jgi:two-component system sensor histidine kinase KdpD